MDERQIAYVAGFTPSGSRVHLVPRKGPTREALCGVGVSIMQGLQGDAKVCPRCTKQADHKDTTQTHE